MAHETLIHASRMGYLQSLVCCSKTQTDRLLCVSSTCVRLSRMEYICGISKSFDAERLCH